MSKQTKAQVGAFTQDVEITPAPTDGITSMRIIDNRFLLVSSWDTVPSS